MKNRHFEYMRASSKRYAKNWRRANTKDANGVVLFHSYSKETKQVLGWWDDVAFKLGSQIIQVWWTHPRLKFSDATDEMASIQLESSKPEQLDSLFESGEKIFKKIGKNKKRKRHIATRMGSIDPSWSLWFDAINAAKKEIQQTTDLQIKASMKITQLDWGRGVAICAPIEVIDELSATKMALLVKHMLLNKTSVEQLWGDYTYTKEDWIKELPLMSNSQTSE